MMVDTRIYGYVFEGWVACPDCTSSDPYTTESGAVYFDGSHDHGPSCEDGSGYCERVRGYGVFSHEDDGHGLTCDDCGDILFEVWPEVEHEEYGHDDAPEMAEECSRCLEWCQNHAEHEAALDEAEWLDDYCETCADVVNAEDAAHQSGEHSLTTGQPSRACRHCAGWYAE